ncbi:Oxidation resistance protein 1 [Hondaea fermentalgiana]|uniref:Oxidation resistance protein 1 n=1 Tax=Hondaea fermentalgiana TaxID=2315210 RepID=A0A2R5GN75_9STRA|nr:Oxidation resistance protein 1 [Hondaea fermentalgiana]|eukprot:GBG31188.1 Oxidation resistance protein 1 [Hondaea fermentalgiana]
MPGAGSAVVWVGVLLVCHAAFSAVHYKDLNALAGIELAADELIPADVILETLLGVVVATVGAMLNAGKMLPIDGSVTFNKSRALEPVLSSLVSTLETDSDIANLDFVTDDVHGNEAKEEEEEGGAEDGAQVAKIDDPPQQPSPAQSSSHKQDEHEQIHLAGAEDNNVEHDKPTLTTADSDLGEDSTPDEDDPTVSSGVAASESPPIKHRGPKSKATALGLHAHEDDAEYFYTNEKGRPNKAKQDREAKDSILTIADHLRASISADETAPHHEILKAHHPKQPVSVGDDLLWMSEAPGTSSIILFVLVGCIAFAFQRSARLRFAASRILAWARRRLTFVAPRLAARIRGLVPASLSSSKRSSGRHTVSDSAGASGTANPFALPRAKFSDLQDHVSALASSVTKKAVKSEDARKHTEMQSLARAGALKPQRRDVPSGFRSVISDEAMESLLGHLPERLTAMNWSLLYASEVHGYNLTTAYQKAQGHGPFLVVVMDMNRYVFGAFSNEALACGPRQYYGTGESFIFQLEPAFRCHHWSGGNSQFVLSTKDMLAFGGGGHFALFLDAMFEQGSSEAGSTTFEPYEGLASNSRFKCCAVEIWGFTSPMLSSPKRRARPFPTFR